MRTIDPAHVLQAVASISTLGFTVPVLIDDANVILDGAIRVVRQLATLAFVSPRIIAAIVDGTAPADLTVTDLAKALPYSWAEQEQSIGLLQ